MKFKETIIAFIISVILVVSLEYTNNKIKGTDKSLTVTSEEERINSAKNVLRDQDNEKDTTVYTPDLKIEDISPNLYYTNLPTYNVDKYFLLAVIEVHKIQYSLFGLSEDGRLDRYEIDRQTREFLVKSGIHDRVSIALNKQPKQELLKGYIEVYGSKDLTALYNAYYNISGKNLK